MILADTDTIPTIIQIPKQIQKQELLKLMPLEWLTNYEQFHQNSEPVQTTEATFERRQNGQVKLSFQIPESQPVQNTPRLYYTAMITAVQTDQEKKLPIHGFSSKGYPVYPDKINGHFLWDVPDAHMRQSYEESFPPLEKQTDTQTRVVSNPFVESPVTASGQPEEPKQYEAILNWQTKNVNAQNQTLKQLGKRIDRVASQVSRTETKVDSISHHLDQMYIHLQDRISELDTDLRRMINNHIWGPKFNNKEAEIRKLKAELARIDAEKTRPTLFTQTQSTLVPSPVFETYSPFHTPPRPRQPKQYVSPIRQSHSSSSSTNSTSTSTDSESEYADITSILMATKTEDPSASTSTPIVEDSSSDDEHKASHTEPVPPMPPPAHDHSTKPSSASWFTFDDIPHHRWSARLQEFAAWIDLQGTKPNAQSQAVLHEFTARSTGSLRDCLESLEEYRQLQFMQSHVGTTLNIIHEQFIGEKTASTDADRKEYHQMKCCSLKRHLLESHLKRMSILFYKLNGFNEPSLKHVFIASLPSELQLDLQRKLTATNLSIADISLGKIFQMAMLCLDKIYVESTFSEQSEQDDQTAFIITESSDFEDISVISTVQNVNHVSTIPRPSLKMSILPSKFHKPVPVIGFIDTGTDTSMIDPSVLPSDYWEPHSKLFRAVNGETFETTLITKKPIESLNCPLACAQKWRSSDHRWHQSGGYFGQMWEFEVEEVIGLSPLAA
ncbi:hypothetical protein KPL70_007560 [Citrus sinensis]|nr:hypothetical protein KPL70_007560 [Citrus sinensis]